MDKEIIITTVWFENLREVFGQLVKVVVYNTKANTKIRCICKLWFDSVVSGYCNHYII